MEAARVGLRYGGADVVAELASVLQEQLAKQAKFTAELRAATFTFLRVHRRRSLESIAQQGGDHPNLRRACHSVSRQEVDACEALNEPGLVQRAILRDAVMKLG